ncbi:MAG: M28 family peptidase [Armatimonadetes bacterium]|nr:M28 family peptidase [Armatimonadota bacterium]
MKKAFVLVSLSLLAALVFSNRELTASNIRRHVEHLASPALAGRFAPSEGSYKASLYVAEEFKKAGLKPMGNVEGGYLYEFNLAPRSIPSPDSSFAVNSRGEWKSVAGTDFVPVGFTVQEPVEGECVFVGSGIVNDEQDDYAGIDVNGKIAVILRTAPGRAGQTNLRNRARVANEKGAKGAIFVDVGTGSFAAFQRGSALLPAIMARASAFESSEWQEAFKAGKGTPPAIRVRFHAKVETKTDKAHNVVGMLEGSDPKLKDEVIVIGAHHDHLGYGETGAMDFGNTDAHLGADDNASGTSVMIELAHTLAAQTPPLKRSVLFMAFNAEELGLVGSARYVANPTVPVEKMVAMINLDMVGRLKRDMVLVGGVGTSPDWRSIVDKANSEGLQFRYDEAGLGPSDHSSFFQKNIPVLFFFTGLHDDYHRASDTPDKVNYDGAARIAKVTKNVVVALDERKEKLAFNKTSGFLTDLMWSGGSQEASRQPEPQPTAGRAGSRVRIGFVPDYGDGGGQGLLLSGVSDNSPAERAGLKAGDRVIELAGTKITGIEDLAEAFQGLSPGKAIKVKIIREGKTLEIDLTPEAPGA